MKRLDLIEEQPPEVVVPVETVSTEPSASSGVESMGVESIPTSGDVATSGSSSAQDSSSAPVTQDTSATDWPSPAYPCPPERPYAFNGQCVQCYQRGGSQCWPGYSCEIPRLKCEPLCSTDRDCIFRQNTLPVCDRVYRSCRYCLNDAECDVGLVCLGQCVPPPPPGASMPEWPEQADAAQPSAPPLDAGAMSSGDGR